MNLGDIVHEVRELVNDQFESYRWGNEIILSFLKDSVVRLNNIRPDSRYLNGRIFDIEWPKDLSAFEIPNEYLRWKQGFVYYASARCLEMDSSDTNNLTLAQLFMQRAEERFQQ